jgi:thiosulfate dehydrogenase (quinone) large subunit
MREMVDEQGEQKDQGLAYGIFRMAIGVNLFGHALVRILGGVGGFADWMVQNMNGTILPAWMVRPFAYCLTVEELVVGVLLIVGWWTRPALVVGGLAMMALMWGLVVKQEWGGAGMQVIYCIAFFLLLFFRRHDRYSVDGWLAGRG